MTRTELICAAERFFDRCVETMRTKNADYSDARDVFAACRANAAEAGIAPRQNLGALYQKHHDTIMKHVRGEELAGEALASRLVDAVNYLVLLGELDREERKGAERA